MKNLAFHKKQVKQHRQRNIHEQAMRKVDEMGLKILVDSNTRFDALLADLRLQRCNLERRQFERVYPYFDYDRFVFFFGKQRVMNVVNWVVDGGPVPSLLNCDSFPAPTRF